MRPLGQPTLDHLAQADGINARLLVTIAARDPVAGAQVNLAYWSGDADREFTLNGVTRLFSAVEGAINLEPVEYTASLDARRHRLRFVGLPAEIDGLLRDIDLHMAPVEVWRVFLAPEVKVDTPHRLLRGWYDGGVANTGAEGQSGEIDMTIASASLALTRTIDRRWSDATQRKRAPGTFVDTQVVIGADTTVAIAAGTEFIDVEIVGAGGGGGSVSPTFYNSVAGSAGGQTSVNLLSDTTVVQGWAALGGAGGYGTSSSPAGGTTALTPAGDGGAGQPAGSNPDMSWPDQQGGGAGQYLKITGYSVSGVSIPKLQVAIGAGGGGFQQGGAGKVILHQYARTGPADGFLRYAAVAGEVAIEWQ